MKNTSTILIILIFVATGCSNRIVLKRWEGNVVFNEGDKVLFVLKNEIDTLPKCQDLNNIVDSIRGLDFKIIHKIEKSNCSLIKIKEYKFDTLCRRESPQKESIYQTSIFGDSGWCSIYKVPIYTTPEIIPYDSIDYIIEPLLVTECDSYFKRIILPPFYGKKKLYRWKIEKDKFRIKGKH